MSSSTSIPVDFFIVGFTDRREAAFSHVKHFHAHNNVTASNIAGHLSSQSKFCSYEQDRGNSPEETELKLSFWNQEEEGWFSLSKAAFWMSRRTHNTDPDWSEQINKSYMQDNLKVK